MDLYFLPENDCLRSVKHERTQVIFLKNKKKEGKKKGRKEGVRVYFETTTGEIFPYQKFFFFS